MPIPSDNGTVERPIQTSDNVAARLTHLQEAEAHYAVMAQCILDLTQQAAQLFELAEVDEKR